jgi:hypothetical protein
MLTLGNGYLATRGAAPEAESDDVHYPGTYLAGFHNRLSGAGPSDGEESIVNLPNWLPLTFRPAGGYWFAPGRGCVHEHRVLDLRRGVYLRELLVVDRARRRTRSGGDGQCRWRAPSGNAGDEHRRGELVEPVEVRSGIDGGWSMQCASGRWCRGRHLTDVASNERPETIC